MGHLRGRAFYIGSRAVQREKIAFSPVFKTFAPPLRGPKGGWYELWSNSESGWLVVLCKNQISGIAEPDYCQNYQCRLSPPITGLVHASRLTVCMQSSILLKHHGMSLPGVSYVSTFGSHLPLCMRRSIVRCAKLCTSSPA